MRVASTLILLAGLLLGATPERPGHQCYADLSPEISHAITDGNMLGKWDRRGTLELLTAIAGVESAFRPDAISPVGARGLMQLTRPAVREAAEWCDLPRRPTDAELLRPKLNVRYATCFIAAVRGKYTEGTVELLTYYNGGGRQLARLRKGKKLAEETGTYVLRVLDRYHHCTRG